MVISKLSYLRFLKSEVLKQVINIQAILRRHQTDSVVSGNFTVDVAGNLRSFAKAGSITCILYLHEASARWRLRRHFDATSEAFIDSANNRIDQSIFARRSVTRPAGGKPVLLGPSLIARCRSARVPRFRGSFLVCLTTCSAPTCFFPAVELPFTFVCRVMHPSFVRFWSFHPLIPARILAMIAFRAPSVIVCRGEAVEAGREKK
jgi:hypothetical protein